MIINNLNKKVRINYPCRWLYKVIGTNQSEIKMAVKEIIREESCSISFSNSSSKGKYHCLNVEVKVSDETRRNTIYEELKAHHAVKTVL